MTAMRAPSSYVEIQVQVVMHGEQTLEEFADAVADELHGLRDSSSRDLGVDLKSGMLTFCFTFEGPTDPEKIIKRAISLARTAFHASGGATPGWEIGRVTFEHSTTDQTLVSA